MSLNRILTLVILVLRVPTLLYAQNLQMSFQPTAHSSISVSLLRTQLNSVKVDGWRCNGFETVKGAQRAPWQEFLGARSGYVAMYRRPTMPVTEQRSPQPPGPKDNHDAAAGHVARKGGGPSANDADNNNDIDTDHGGEFFVWIFPRNKVNSLASIQSDLHNKMMIQSRHPELLGQNDRYIVLVDGDLDIAEKPILEIAKLLKIRDESGNSYK